MSNDYSDPIERFLDLILDTRYEDLPAEAVEAATVFFLDTVGVACAGRLAPKLAELTDAAQRWGSAGALGATIWNTGVRAPAPVAALANGYQCHALEYDCVYEPGVILPAAPVMGALMTKVEELAAQGRPPSGRDVLRAFVVALEVSCTLAAASRSAMFFFRPAPGWSQYRTPIDGYYQCGSGTHPGGCVMGAPGKLAAGQIMKDRSKTGAKAGARA